MSPEQLQARVVAQATQVALLHTALRRAVPFLTDEAARQATAALDASEPECDRIVRLARRLALAPIVEDRMELATIAERNTLAVNLLAELDRLEGRT